MKVHISHRTAATFADILVGSTFMLDISGAPVYSVWVKTQRFHAIALARPSASACSFNLQEPVYLVTIKNINVVVGAF